MTTEHINGVAVVADLSGADAVPSDTAIVYTVKPGTNIRTGWNITLAGPGHPKSIVQNNETERKRLHKAAQIERAQVNGKRWKNPDEDKQPNESRREFVEAIVARIVCWTPVNFGDGPVEFNEGDSLAPKRAVDLLLQPKLGPYVSQIVDAIIEEQTFMTGSATP